MKIAQKKTVSFMVFFFSIYSIFAKDPPPAPTYRKPPPPPHLSIDENIFVVVLIALLFGIYIIYNNRLKTKTSI